jgi:hypothetical protein
MLAKKESYLKFLRDDDFPDVKKTKTLNNNELNINKQNIDTKEENDLILIKDSKNKNDFSFQNFVENIKSYNYDKKIKWDSEIHKTSMANDKNMHKIKLTELFRINYTNPLLILNNDYLKDNYESYLFEQEINYIDDKININQNNKNLNNKKNNSIDINNNKNIIENSNKFVENLYEEREKYELNKKVLKYYLLYYCENNYETIAPSVNKMQQLTNDINFFYDKIHYGKNKISKLKKANIDNTMKLILRKKKYDNLSKLYCFLKNNIFECYKDIKKLKLKTMNFDYINYYKESNKIMNNINLIEKDIDKIISRKNKDENIIKIKIVEEIKKKLSKKKEKFNYKYTSEINNLFDSKKSNILQLYYLFNIDNSIQSMNNISNNEIIMNNQSNLFVTKMLKNFKLKSKKLILETVHYFRKKEKQRSNSITILNLNNQKLSNLNNINIEEKDLIICFKNILSKLKNHADFFFILL